MHAHIRKARDDFIAHAALGGLANLEQLAAHGPARRVQRAHADLDRIVARSPAAHDDVLARAIAVMALANTRHRPGLRRQKHQGVCIIVAAAGRARAPDHDRTERRARTSIPAGVIGVKTRRAARRQA